MSDSINPRYGIVDIEIQWSNMTIGQRIKYKRELVGVTQQYMCDKTGLSKGFYSDVENDKRGISAINLKKIADALVITVDCLLKGLNETNDQNIIEVTDQVIIDPIINQHFKEIPPLDDETLNRIKNIFTYHPPKDGQTEIYNEIREYARRFAILISSRCIDSREKSIAMTKLEEVVMWANASIARN